MRMEMTWLDFQLSTTNLNGRHRAIEFFFGFFLKLSVYRYSDSAIILALSFYIWDPKQGYSDYLDFIIDLWLLA